MDEFFTVVEFTEENKDDPKKILEILPETFEKHYDLKNNMKNE